MPRPTPYLFVSSTSKGLMDYREEAGRALRQKGIFAVIQEEFDTDYRTIREMLKDKISTCDGVICIIGPYYGFEPKDRPEEEPRRSYTQLEFFIAQELGKPIYRFFAVDCPEFTSVEPEPPEQAHLQVDFIAKVKGGSEIYHQFHDKNGLRDLVLRIAVPPHDPERKPQNLPYSSLGSLFKGRDEFMNQLHRQLRTSSGGHTAIHGLGGVGKSRLAVEYGLRYAGSYSALLFVIADTTEGLRRNLAALCGPLVLNLEEKDAPEEEAKVNAALRWLQTHPGWLLILDNADTQEAAAAVEEMLDQLQGGHVLITSRLAVWSGGVKPLEVDVLSEDTATAFLLERTEERRRKTQNDAADARQLASNLCSLALALEQAGAFIHQKRCSLADYLKLWGERDAAVRVWFDERLMKYPRSVATTWNTTIDQLGPTAADLLRMMSWLAPDPIPRTLLPSGELQDALAELANYSMARLEADGDRFRVHRLVQEVTCERQNAEEQAATIRAALDLLVAFAPAGPDDVRTWPLWDLLRPHVAAVTAHADMHGITKPTSLLMNQLALLLLKKALHTEAEPLMRRALAIDEQSFGADHPDVARDLNNLAQLLQATNRLAEAEPLMRRALAILLMFTQATGHEHPHLRAALDNYVGILQAIGLTQAAITQKLNEVFAEAGHP